MIEEKSSLSLLILNGGIMKGELEELLLEVKSSQAKLIIEFLINNFEELPNMKLEQIANLCYCSKTSVRRIIIKLGYKGFLEYQLHIKLELNKSDDKQVTGEIVYDHSQLQMLSNFIKDSNYIYIYGRGASSLSAQYLFRMMLEKGYKVVWINDPELLYNLQNQKLIIISKSGQSPSIVKIANELMKQDCQIAVITRKRSELAKMCDVKLLHNLENSLSSEDQIDVFNTINSLIKLL